LIISEWPENEIERDIEAEKAHSLSVDIIREVRKLRAENNIMPNKTIKLKIYAKNKNAEIVKEALELIS
jgi:valyl-tRNA synthetase